MRRLFALFLASMLLLSPSTLGHAGADSSNPPSSIELRVSSQATEVSLTLISWRSYWYQDQILWVVGEIQNTGAVPVANPLVTGHFSDSAGKPAAEAAAFADSQLLSPGGISTFRITLVNTVSGGVRLDAIDLKGLSAFVQHAAYEEIEQDRVTYKKDCDAEKRNDCAIIDKVLVNTGNYIVEGGVRNSSSAPLMNVRVTVAVYDQSREIINTGISSDVIPVLQPGETQSYRIIVYWAPNVSTYTVRPVYADNV
jgi:hypothetical protein